MATIVLSTIVDIDRIRGDEDGLSPSPLAIPPSGAVAVASSAAAPLPQQQQSRRDAGITEPWPSLKKIHAAPQETLLSIHRHIAALHLSSLLQQRQDCSTKQNLMIIPPFFVLKR
jgi:hypothetical protein